MVSEPLPYIDAVEYISRFADGLACTHLRTLASVEHTFDDQWGEIEARHAKNRLGNVWGYRDSMLFSIVLNMQCMYLNLYLHNLYPGMVTH